MKSANSAPVRESTETKPRNPLSLPWWVMLLSGVALATLIKVLFAPATSPGNWLKYPSPPPLPGWQYIPGSQTEEMPTPHEQRDEYANSFDNGQIYRYKRPDSELMAFFTYNYYVGNLHSSLYLLHGITADQLTEKQRSPDEIVALYEWEGSAYLSACLTTKGATTVTRSQYMNRRYQEDFTPMRFLVWATGREPFWNHGCLWMLLKLDTETPMPLSERYQVLESAWENWLPWWQEYQQQPGVFGQPPTDEN